MEEGEEELRPKIAARQANTLHYCWQILLRKKTFALLVNASAEENIVFIFFFLLISFLHHHVHNYLAVCNLIQFSCPRCSALPTTIWTLHAQKLNCKLKFTKCYSSRAREACSQHVHKLPYTSMLLPFCWAFSRDQWLIDNQRFHCWVEYFLWSPHNCITWTATNWTETPVNIMWLLIIYWLS